MLSEFDLQTRPWGLIDSDFYEPCNNLIWSDFHGIDPPEQPDDTFKPIEEVLILGKDYSKVIKKTKLANGKIVYLIDDSDNAPQKVWGTTYDTHAEAVSALIDADREQARYVWISYGGGS
jgi:hypothetical protein